MASLPKSAAMKFAETADAKAKNPDAKFAGRPKGSPKTSGSGKRKGLMNRSTLEREQTLANALIVEFERLTPEQVESITPTDIMRLCALSAVKLGNWGLALMASEKWAPYVHPKLAAVVHHEGGRVGPEIEGGEDDEFPGGDPGLRVRILGGLPGLEPNRPVRDAEVADDATEK
jgi:hypothetical protein